MPDSGTNWRSDEKKCRAFSEREKAPEKNRRGSARSIARKRGVPRRPGTSSSRAERLAESNSERVGDRSAETRCPGRRSGQREVRAGGQHARAALRNERLRQDVHTRLRPSLRGARQKRRPAESRPARPVQLLQYGISSVLPRQRHAHDAIGVQNGYFHHPRNRKNAE